MKNAKTIDISAKCSDLFDATVYDGKGKALLDYTGYVPGFFPDDHYGDYVRMKIELKTGKILNWKQPTAVDFEHMESQSRHNR